MSTVHRGSRLAAIWFVFRQRLDEVIKTEPQTPTVMIKGDREDQRHDEEKHQNTFVFGADHEQHEEAEDEDHQLCYHHIRQDRAHEKPVFTLVKGQTFGAVMADVERALDD